MRTSRGKELSRMKPMLSNANCANLKCTCFTCIDLRCKPIACKNCSHCGPSLTPCKSKLEQEPTPPQPDCLAELERLTAKLERVNAASEMLCSKIQCLLTAMCAEEVDTPCPSTIGLDDADLCGLTCAIGCRECWERALAGDTP